MSYGVSTSVHVRCPFTYVGSACDVPVIGRPYRTQNGAGDLKRSTAVSAVQPFRCRELTKGAFLQAFPVCFQATLQLQLGIVPSSTSIERWRVFRCRNRVTARNSVGATEDPEGGGDSSGVELTNIQLIQSTSWAFAALRSDGHMAKLATLQCKRWKDHDIC